MSDQNTNNNSGPTAWRWGIACLVACVAALLNVPSPLVFLVLLLVAGMLAAKAIVYRVALHAPMRDIVDALDYVKVGGRSVKPLFWASVGVGLGSAVLAHLIGNSVFAWPFSGLAYISALMNPALLIAAGRRGHVGTVEGQAARERWQDVVKTFTKAPVDDVRNCDFAMRADGGVEVTLVPKVADSIASLADADSALARVKPEFEIGYADHELLIIQPTSEATRQRRRNLKASGGLFAGPAVATPVQGGVGPTPTHLATAPISLSLSKEDLR